MARLSCLFILTGLQECLACSVIVRTKCGLTSFAFVCRFPLSFAQFCSGYEYKTPTAHRLIMPFCFEV